MSNQTTEQSNKQTKEEFISDFNKIITYCKSINMECEEIDIDPIYDSYESDEPFVYELLCFTPVTLTEMEYFMIRSHNNDFNFLDGYNENVKNFIIQLCLCNNYLSSIHDRLDDFFNLLDNLDDILDAIKIIHENKLGYRSNEELDSITDEDLNYVILNSTIKESENSNLTKMEKLFDLVTQNKIKGDFTIKFKFNDNEVKVSIYSFILTEEYFDNLVNKYLANNVTFIIDSDFNKEVCVEVIRYLHTGRINTKISIESVLSLCALGNEYQLKLEDICNRILNLNDKLRIDNIIEPNFVLISTNNKYPIYSLKYKLNVIVLIKYEDKFYYYSEIDRDDELDEIQFNIHLDEYLKRKFIKECNIIIDKNFVRDLSMNTIKKNIYECLVI